MADWGGPGHMMCDHAMFGAIRKNYDKPSLLMASGNKAEFEYFEALAVEYPQLLFVKMLDPTEFAHQNVIFRDNRCKVFVVRPSGIRARALEVRNSHNFRTKLKATIDELSGFGQ